MVLALHDLRGQGGAEKLALELGAATSVSSSREVAEVVAEIIARVRQEGDSALRDLTQKFDGVRLDNLIVPADEVKSASNRLSPEVGEALRVAHQRIYDFHKHQQPPDHAEMTSEGVTISDLRRPVARAGCYAPGGRARYPSTVLMCATPARVAGVEEVVLCVPPDSSGRVDDATLAAAFVAGVDVVYCLGGAQAVAALAFGTQSVKAVDIIVGPGNRFVAEAMRQVSGVVGIPASYAGPSEVVVVAGPETPAELAAVDLVLQVEHGPDGSAWLVTWSKEKLEEIVEVVARLVEESPRKSDLRSSLSTGGHGCLVDDPIQALDVANFIAPEHLELMFEGAEDFLPRVRAAGAVFIGQWSPASLGDYIAGPNHVLPTNRSARFASALSAEDFVRHIHVIKAEPQALQQLGPHVIALAEAEGLPAHADSIRRRL